MDHTLLIQNNFEDTIVSEYEGGIAIIDVFPLEELEQVRHHQVVRKRLLGMQEVLTSYLALRCTMQPE